MTTQPRRNTKIVLTFRAIQLVNHLRRRVEGLAIQDGCFHSHASLELERRPSRSLRKGLSKIHTSKYGKKQHQLSNRVRRRHRKRRHLLPPSASNGSSLKRILRTLDSHGAISCGNRQLSAVCSDDTLFLRTGRFSFGAYPLNDRIHSLLLVREALNILRAARAEKDDSFLFAQGIEIGLVIDELFIANYEHLLLRLQSQLVESLTRKAIEALIQNDLNKTQRKLLAWFSEFAHSRRPLSTTWPWSIKPSLAVLWGVCWMYYNSPRRQHQDSSNRVRRLLQDEQVRAWNSPHPNEYFQFGLQLTGREAQGPGSQAAGGDEFIRRRADGGGHSHREALEVEDGDSVGQDWNGLSMPRAGLGRCEAASRGHGATQPHMQGTDGSELASVAGRRPYYNGFPATNDHVVKPSNPDISGINIATQEAIFAFPQEQLDIDQLNESWQFGLQENQLPLESTASHLTQPRITLTHSNNAHAQPRTEFSHLYPQHQSRELHLRTALPDFSSSSYNYLPQERSPLHSPSTMNENTQSIPSPSNLRSPSTLETPVNATGARSSLGNDQSRRPSAASSIARGPSEDRSSQDGENGRSPGKTQVYKRLEDPPRDANNKMYCNYPGCSGFTFDRKCEWGKHMDKHERPYKCTHPNCEKLQGFTYGGGLARHQREVHGPESKAIFCPYQDCKRSTGQGFTRRENLHEHLRRVHRNTRRSNHLDHASVGNTQQNTSSQQPTDLSLPKAAFESQPSQSAEGLPISPGKRKHDEVSGTQSFDAVEMLAEVKRLRKENEEKDAKIRELMAQVGQNLRPA